MEEHLICINQKWSPFYLWTRVCMNDLSTNKKNTSFWCVLPGESISENVMMIQCDNQGQRSISGSNLWENMKRPTTNYKRFYFFNNRLRIFNIKTYLKSPKIQLVEGHIICIHPNCRHSIWGGITLAPYSSICWKTVVHKWNVGHFEFKCFLINNSGPISEKIKTLAISGGFGYFWP